MKNSIAIVGRTNVGKSLLFNKLTKSRRSLVIDHHGVTRDINTGELLLGNYSVNIEDTFSCIAFMNSNLSGCFNIFEMLYTSLFTTEV